MSVSPRIALLIASIVLEGCFIDRTGTGGGSSDGGPSDTGTLDAGSDAGPPMEDAGPECVAHDPFCEGETLVRCIDSARVEEDCTAMSAYCDVTQCTDWICTPSRASCIDDTTEERCDVRGIGSTTTPCTRGCTAELGCNPPTACGLAIHATVTGPGTMRIDTCGEGDDAVFVSGCTREDISGPDLLVRFEVAVRTSYRFELRVMGGSDAVLYLRSACAVQSSELACDDDDAAGFGSRIDIVLDPGDYFLVLDSFRDAAEPPSGRCGEMDLVITIR